MGGELMSMRGAGGLVFLLSLAGIPAVAQDSVDLRRPAGVPPRQQIEERFAQRVKEELGLTEEQSSKLRQVAGTWFMRRRGLEADERALRQALAGQLRPGIAANADSVSRLTQRLLDLKVAYAETYRDENRELGFLTPVQQAQFHVLRERLLDALDAARQNRQGRRLSN
jgi:hypothetical protein